MNDKNYLLGKGQSVLLYNATVRDKKMGRHINMKQARRPVLI
jgi:hypothetical protein